MEETGVFLSFSKDTYLKKDGTKGTSGYLAIQVQGEYPRTVAFKVWKDAHIAVCDKLTPGTEVAVKYRVESRQWTDGSGRTKWFTDAIAMSVVSDLLANTPHEADGVLPEPDNDDLPF